MKILSIAGILPIPGLISSNDFVFYTCEHYIQQYPDDEIIIIRPTEYKTNIKQLLLKTTELKKLGGKRHFVIKNFQVNILPFFSARKLRNLHAILSFSIYLLNKKKIRSLINSHQFDIIHSQYIFPDGLLAYILFKKYKIPYVITTHNELFYFKHFISGLIARKIVDNASFVLPINNNSYKYFKSIDLLHTELIPLGFNEIFIREQKKADPDIVRIVTVAELIKLKNIDKVVLSLLTLVSKYNISYTVIGKGPEKERLKKLVADQHLDRYVTFVEHVPHEQIADEIYKYDIFIMPSYVETFGRVYFEAMAMGIPIICARNSGIYGYFKEMTEGISVKHDDIENISGALEYLISDEKRRLSIGKAGQNLVKKYTWTHIVQMYHEKYMKVIENKKHSGL